LQQEAEPPAVERLRQHHDPDHQRQDQQEERGHRASAPKRARRVLACSASAAAMNAVNGAGCGAGPTCA
jgi:hypothetical protein